MCYAFLFTLPFRVCFRRAGKRLSSRQLPNMMDSVELPNQARRHIPTAHSQTWQKFASLCANCAERPEASWEQRQYLHIFQHLQRSGKLSHATSKTLTFPFPSRSLAASLQMQCGCACMSGDWWKGFQMRQPVAVQKTRAKSGAPGVAAWSPPPRVAQSSLFPTVPTLEKPWKLLVNYAEICSTLCL